MASTEIDGQGSCHLLLHFHLSTSHFFNCMKLFVNKWLKTTLNTLCSACCTSPMLPEKQQAAPRTLLRGCLQIPTGAQNTADLGPLNKVQH